MGGGPWPHMIRGIWTSFRGTLSSFLFQFFWPGMCVLKLTRNFKKNFKSFLKYVCVETDFKTVQKFQKWWKKYVKYSKKTRLFVRGGDMGDEHGIYKKGDKVYLTKNVKLLEDLCGVNKAGAGYLFFWKFWPEMCVLKLCWNLTKFWPEMCVLKLTQKLKTNWKNKF